MVVELGTAIRAVVSERVVDAGPRYSTLSFAAAAAFVCHCMLVG